MIQTKMYFSKLPSFAIMHNHFWENMRSNRQVLTLNAKLLSAHEHSSYAQTLQQREHIPKQGKRSWLREGDHIQTTITQNETVELLSCAALPHCFSSLALCPLPTHSTFLPPRFLTGAPLGFVELLSRNQHQGY